MATSEGAAPGVRGERRAFRREGETARREALVLAAVSLVAEGGIGAATVRAVADRAGVTAGLIRHYFGSREALLLAAYRHVMDGMAQSAEAAVQALPRAPLPRLAAFVAASLRPPVVDPAAVGVWAGFIHMVQRDPAVRDTHRATYLGFRDRLEALIAALPREAAPDRDRADAIACNAVIDGLWLEASVLPETFRPGEIEAIGLASVGRILGVELPAPAPREDET